MAVTARLSIPLLEAGQEQKEVTINNALNAFDAAAVLLSQANVFLGASTFNATVTIADGINVVAGTSTGTKIGTGTTQKFGFFNATPIAQPVNTTDLRTAFINLGFLATGGATPLNLNGGSLTALDGLFSGALQGNGTSLQVRRLQFTFASDANDALDAGEKGSVIIEIQTGVISATRVLDLVTTNVGGVWLIHNGEAFPVTLKIGAGTGITVASHRSRVIYTTGGVNVFSAGPDQDYTV